MQIHGPAHVHGPQPIHGPHRASSVGSSPSPSFAEPADELQISREADLVSRAREAPEVRADRVARIRAAIEAGVYETPEKLEIALGRLLDELT